MRETAITFVKGTGPAAPPEGTGWRLHSMAATAVAGEHDMVWLAWERTVLDLDKDEAARLLLRTLWLYKGHVVDSRGPWGLILDAIERLRPDLRNALDEMTEEEVLDRFFPNTERL